VTQTQFPSLIGRNSKVSRISIVIARLADHLTNGSDERMQKTSDLVTRPGTVIRLTIKCNGKLASYSKIPFTFLSLCIFLLFFWDLDVSFTSICALVGFCEEKFGYRPLTSTGGTLHCSLYYRNCSGPMYHFLDRHRCNPSS
jgi:hypothetical protein